LNEFSSEFESNETASLINANDDIGATSNSPESSENDTSDDSCYPNDSLNEIITSPDGQKKSMLKVIPGDIAICSDQESSFPNKIWNNEVASCRQN
jgi:hypothetical protein